MSYSDTHLNVSGPINAPIAAEVNAVPLLIVAASQPSSPSPDNPGVAPKTAPLAPGEPDEEQPYRQPAPKPEPPKKGAKK